MAMVIAAGVAGCKDGPELSGQNVGTVAGALGGALIGSQIGDGSGRTVAILGGAVLGGLLGRELGARLDKNDKQAMKKTTGAALNNAGDGITYSWNNEKTGHSGTVTPTKTFRNSNRQLCREYEQSLNVNGRTDSDNGTACRAPDGSWQVL